MRKTGVPQTAVLSIWFIITIILRGGKPFSEVAKEPLVTGQGYLETHFPQVQ
ncbi:MAG: hypothetical protein JO313_16790 [Verrucomicrobia bacterium]|nr:hypothetical protein [Verrucomicrobiota bacterium]